MLLILGVFVVALSCFSAAAPPGQRSGNAIPINKHSRLVNTDGTVDFDALDRHASLVKGKILRGVNNFKKRTGTTEAFSVKEIGERGYGDALTDYNDVLWYGNITVGTPPFPLSVVFDTGSSDIFVSTSICDATCTGHALWDPGSSSTAVDQGYQVELAYGGGAAAWCELYTDTVAIGDFVANGQSVGAATSYSSGFQMPQYPADGVMGMAFQSISDFNASPFFQTLIQENQMTEPAFSFKMTSSGAELYIGGSNSALYTGEFSYVTIMEQSFWMVEMDNLQGNSETILTGVKAIVDTGTTFIVGIPSDVSELYKLVGGTLAPYGQGYYTFPCDSFPDISLTFGGNSFSIPASALNLGTVSTGSSDCVSAIVGQDVGYPFWVIGGAFLQGVYTTFDVGNLRVGFAQLA